jgi:hypothetical protein
MWEPYPSPTKVCLPYLSFTLIRYQTWDKWNVCLVTVTVLRKHTLTCYKHGVLMKEPLTTFIEIIDCYNTSAKIPHALCCHQLVSTIPHFVFYCQVPLCVKYWSIFNRDSSLCPEIYCWTCNSETHFPANVSLMPLSWIKFVSRLILSNTIFWDLPTNLSCIKLISSSLQNSNHSLY